MLQVTQKLGSGEMVIQEIPYPQISKGMVIVKNHFSVISAGTEGSTVSAARKSLIGKAAERPQQVKLVLDTLKKQGPIQTYRAVMKKLDSYSPMGYSCAGEVVEVGSDVQEFKIGDLVACAGVGFANHAEIVSIPVNLCVKLADDANLAESAYNTLGAIAMQGVRQADLRLGESCVIIGLGLLGQLASLLLKASGVKVIGVDVSDSAVKFALENNVVDFGYPRNESGLEDQIQSLTNGYGADAVIISAGTQSLDPINFAGAVARKKGRVIVLGAVPTGFDRDPFWYRKELELKMACSYGPGRYDLNYEEKGLDYPLAYVRWTQKRNMQAFQNLLERKIISVGFLTTHEFPFIEAPKAFDLVVNKNEPYIGILLKYDFEKKHSREKVITNEKKIEGQVNISFVGAGSYAQGNLLPNLNGIKDISKIGVLTNSGTTSKRVAEKYKFNFSASHEDQIFEKSTNTVFIATRHDSHAYYVLKSLKSNKNVFVEKPICLLESELEAIKSAYEISGTSLMVGFNRRFSPLSKMIKDGIPHGPMSMIYRINSGIIPFDSWIQDIEIGGGRIIGEVCHFVDFMTYICGSLPEMVSAMTLPDSFNLNDTVNISIKFKNGSIGIIAYYSNGSKELPKEYFEVFSSGSSAVLNDFKSLKVYSKGKVKKASFLNQNKGQKEMVSEFVEGIKKSGKSPISFEEIYSVTKSTFKAIESIQNAGKYIQV
ncbi:Predicted dehydrogenase [Aquiflexum balticum DSM 16537]|uniref:Predicted dehydrogenase n=1 Tax=Aquiflexum balticum DSM 16537 TaxID=758820 RepID=A0A1W2H7K4_9BACT|nr:bi-domain-containing oxidoreductase [Aquiflexum balticum]SMD44628.1 Predicted dehydrogenase [Aquiflexum balticum DSM 16537]